MTYTALQRYTCSKEMANFQKNTEKFDSELKLQYNLFTKAGELLNKLKGVKLLCKQKIFTLTAKRHSTQ